eukprot:1381216-Amorphochlora_amoeboformis.AAC.1
MIGFRNLSWGWERVGWVYLSAYRFPGVGYFLKLRLAYGGCRGFGFELKLEVGFALAIVDSLMSTVSLASVNSLGLGLGLGFKVRVRIKDRVRALDKLGNRG